jgi:hypothetical protein
VAAEVEAGIQTAILAGQAAVADKTTILVAHSPVGLGLLVKEMLAEMEPVALVGLMTTMVEVGAALAAPGFLQITSQA